MELCQSRLIQVFHVFQDNANIWFYLQIATKMAELDHQNDFRQLLDLRIHLSSLPRSWRPHIPGKIIKYGDFTYDRIVFHKPYSVSDLPCRVCLLQ